MQLKFPITLRLESAKLRIVIRAVEQNNSTLINAINERWIWYEDFFVIYESVQKVYCMYFDRSGVVLISSILKSFSIHLQYRSYQYYSCPPLTIQRKSILF